MDEKENNKLFALVGKNISYSFSRGYFTEKFLKEKLTKHTYVNFDLENISYLTEKIKENREELKGMNVTIPYKQSVINFLDKIDKTALKIGAVNTIKITKKGNLKGYNTDIYGFKNSLKPLLKKKHKQALILGTGGASKAVAYALKKMKIKYKFVSRIPKGKKQISYNDLNRECVNKHLLIINCTPVGTYPNENEAPNIPYDFITEKHLLYDLIYNPAKTTFLKNGEAKGATIKNGLEMLELQAEKAWRIWHT